MHAVSTIAPKACNACEWSYSNLVCSDRSHSLFVAAFTRVRERIEDDPRRSYRYVRRFDGLVTDEDLFGSSGSEFADGVIQWGAKDKIYRYCAGEIDTVTSRPGRNAPFYRMQRRKIPAEFSFDQFVGVRVAPFGSVLEFDNEVAVLLNSGDILKFPGEPVSWRVFPRSLNYLNHLHLIYEDRIEIVCFTNDYFIPPGERLFGTEPISADDERTD